MKVTVDNVRKEDVVEFNDRNIWPSGWSPKLEFIPPNGFKSSVKKAYSWGNEVILDNWFRGYINWGNVVGSRTEITFRPYHFYLIERKR